MTAVKTAPEPFVEEVRRILQHLYDPTLLGRTPLLVWLDVDQRHNPPTALRRLILDAIRALEPSRDVPVHSNAWRLYQVLSWRYVEQSQQRDVAANLAVSPRQLRRLERTAAQALSDYLWNRYDLGASALAATAADAETEAEAEPAEDKGGRQAEAPDRQQELRWVRSSFPNERVEVGDLLVTVCRTVMPLARDRGTTLVCDDADTLPAVTAQQAALRQALLSLLTMAIHAAPGGTVSIEAQAAVSGLCISVEALPDPESGPQTRAVTGDWQAEKTEYLKMARQFAQILGATLDVLVEEESGEAFVARLRLPRGAPQTVLVIDDNVDTLHLLRRYMADTSYRMVSVQDPERALTVAEATPPDIIVLDIMLPNVDGWELLGRMREHPRLGKVPTVVCTILPQEKLALTLGAAAFLRKPFTRQAFLTALEGLSPAPRSC